MLYYGAIPYASIKTNNQFPVDGVDTGRNGSIEFNTSDAGMKKRDAAVIKEALNRVKPTATEYQNGYIEMGSLHEEGMMEELRSLCDEANRSKH